MSAAEIIHPVPAEEVEPWLRRLSATFLNDPHDERTTRRVGVFRDVWDPERAWGARADGRWVATLLTLPRRMTMPGFGDATRDVPVDALTGVTVAPNHRRRGLLRAMLGESLREARERGDPMSVLVAAEWGIYSPHGYAPAVLKADWTLQRAWAGATVAGDPSRLRHIESPEVRELAPPVFEAARSLRAGQIDRDEPWWTWRYGSDTQPGIEPAPHNILAHDGDDGVDGLVAWTAERDSGLLPPLGAIRVSDLVAATPQAYRDIWSYLSGIDGVDEVHVPNRAVDEEVRWLLPNGRALVMSAHVDMVWVRILDTAAALSARRYMTDDELVLDVVDADGDGFAAGTFRLSAEGELAECVAAPGAPADVRIGQRRLASALLGGYRLAEMRPAGGIDELTPGAVSRLGAMLATPRAPWDATWF